MQFQKSLFQSLLWRGLLFVVVLALNVFISRQLGATAAGEVFYYSTIYAFIVLIAGVCLETGLGYYLSAAPQFSRSFAFTAATYTVAVCVMLYLLARFIPFQMNRSYFSKDQVIFYGAMYVGGIMLSNLFTALFHARQNFFLANFLLAFSNAVLVAILFFYADDINRILNIYFLFFLLQGVVLSLAFLLKYGRTTAHSQKPDALIYRKVFKYSFAALLGNIIFFLVYRIDYYFVERYVSDKDGLGNYIQASKLGQLLLIVPNILATAIFPQTASGQSREEINRSLQIISRLLMQVYLFLMLVFLLFGHSIFTMVFGPSFNTMHLAFIILLPGIFALSVLTILSSYFAGKGKLRINITGAAIALVFVILFDYLLIPTYGIIGAAAVSTAGYAINLVYSLWMFYKDYQINMLSFFSIRKSDYVWLMQLFSNPSKKKL